MLILKRCKAQEIRSLIGIIIITTITTIIFEMMMMTRDAEIGLFCYLFIHLFIHSRQQVDVKETNKVSD